MISHLLLTCPPIFLYVALHAANLIRTPEMKEQKKRPTSIAEILGDSADRLKIRDGIKRYWLWDRWEEIVGESVAEFARPSGWRGKTLIVRVVHPSWMQELNFLKPEMLERIRKISPEAAVKDVRFEVGELPASEKISKAELRQAENKLTEDELEFIDQAARQIHDPELREAARRAMKRCFCTKRA